MPSNVIGIIGAMDSEVEYLCSKLENRTKETIYGFDFYCGTLSGKDVVLVKCGIGKVNAARGTQLMIDRYSPAVIVNTGIAGGVAPGICIEDAVIAEGLLQHDFDVSAFGHAKGYLCTGIEHEKPTVFKADEETAKKLRKAADKIIPTEKIRAGLIATGDQFISGTEKRKEIYDLFGATAAEMEGCAIAQVAEYSGIPFAVLRVISDTADGQAVEKYDEFELKAAKQSALIIEEFAKLY